MFICVHLCSSAVANLWFDIAVILFTTIAAASLALAVVVERIAAARDARRFPASGRLIETHGRRMHIRVAGEQHSGPMVVLESGLAASSLGWHFVQSAVAQFARVASYDRSGFGWSEPSGAPRTSAQLADELHELLRAAAAPPPYILVAHSFGAYVAQCFAQKYPKQVAGMVLLDPLPVEEWSNASPQQRRELRRAVMLSRLGAALCRVGFVRLCLRLLAGGSTAMPRTVVRSLGSGPLALTERLAGEIRKLPRELWPQVRAMWSRASSYSTMAAHLRDLPESARQTSARAFPTGVPLTVLSAGNAPPERLRVHAALAQASVRGRHIVVQNSGHWVHFDEPAGVVTAIRQVLEVGRSISGA